MPSTAPLTAAARVRTAALALALLSGCTPVAREVLLLVDQNAGANGQGAIFEIATGESGPRLSPYAASPEIQRPQDVMGLPDGGLLVLDFCDDLGEGRIFRFSPDRKECRRLPIPPGLVDPVHFDRGPDGWIWIVDKNADPLGLGEKPGHTGTVWRLSPDFGTLQIVATGPPLQAPSEILFHGDDAYLLDADAYRVEPYRLENEEGAIFRLHRHPQPPETVVRLNGAISPFGMQRLPSGQFLIVDVNADPVRREAIRGAVYRTDPAKGTTELFANHPDFADPVTCLLRGGELLVVDANADPLGLGADGSRFHFGGKGRGGIYRVDLDTGAVRLFFAAKEFVNPLRLRVVRR